MKAKNQQGMTTISNLFVAAFVVIIGIIVLKVMPVYITHFSVTSSIKNLNKLPKEELRAEGGRAYLREYLIRKLYINEIRFIKKKDINIKRKNKGYVVSVSYIVEKNLINNVYLLFKFNPSYEVSIEGK